MIPALAQRTSVLSTGGDGAGVAATTTSATRASRQVGSPEVRRAAVQRVSKPADALVITERRVPEVRAAAGSTAYDHNGEVRSTPASGNRPIISPAAGPGTGGATCAGTTGQRPYRKVVGPQRPGKADRREMGSERTGRSGAAPARTRSDGTTPDRTRNTAAGKRAYRTWPTRTAPAPRSPAARRR
ncbi:hypothetical protein FHX34_10341 [Actinoplanes teichomyceticus]|uniref:Uncharacterized protein n=1 Tax=Actinoplanes teichomyceticus TaxID=1867 RepID=A0A561W9K5_ACTTI|nr:hypothetical protein FHX34_10341 [Actinoplanes teichomyceticus]